MITLLAGIAMLGVLVFVHEFGHFCVAKLTGVKVLKFSLGFGPRLVSRRVGETEYMLSLIPLGGYVQMLGEGSGDEGEEGELSAEDLPRSFAHKSLLQRALIVAAGPIMNLGLPFVLLPLTFLIGVNMPAFLDRPACIGHVLADSRGGDAGFVAGDCISTINGDAVASWSEVNQTLISHAGGPIGILVNRSGEPTELVLPHINNDLEELQLRNLGLLPGQAARVGTLSPGMPAEEAGMQRGDLIVAIGGAPVDSWYDLKGLIQASGGKSLEFEVQRGSETVVLSIRPERQDGEDGSYLVGIAPQQESVYKRFGLMESISAGANQAGDIIGLTLVFIQKLFSGNVSTKNIGGPIMVFQMAGQAAQTDLVTVFTILAFLSIQLGILNLLPIPILDGGHLFFYLFEFVFRRPLSNRAREVMQQIGLAMIVLLMVLAFYNDLVRLFFRGQ